MIRGWGLEIAGFVGIGMAVALGLAGMHGPSAETWAGIMLLATCGVLMLSVIGAICRGPSDRPRLLGFAAFGWGYFVLARWYSFREGPLPTVGFLPGAGDLHADPRFRPPLVRLAHDAWALAFAILGSTLTSLFFRYPADGEPAIAEFTQPDGDVAGWWRKPAFVGLLGFGMAVVTALTGWRSDPETTAGAIFLVTWALTGLAILGAILARDRRREAWIGAAGFGLGYLVMAFSLIGSPQLPTNNLLNALFRPEGPTTSGEGQDDVLTTDEESQRVRKALDEPISLHFREDTSLKVVLEHIKDAIRGLLGVTFRVYAAPYDRMDLEALRVSIDRDRIPAREALRLCLSPLGLTYRIQSGYIRIYPDAYQPVPYEEDPMMIAGHSLLALIAAAIGGVTAPIIAGFCGRHGQDGGRDTA